MIDGPIVVRVVETRRGGRSRGPPEAIAAAADLRRVRGTVELIEGNPYSRTWRSVLPRQARSADAAEGAVRVRLPAFVFGTSRAIFAKLRYDDILANVDWLHGPVESLLTITNLFIVVGMREGLREARRDGAAAAATARKKPSTAVPGARFGVRVRGDRGSGVRRRRRGVAYASRRVPPRLPPPRLS